MRGCILRSVFARRLSGVAIPDCSLLKGLACTRLPSAQCRTAINGVLMRRRVRPYVLVCGVFFIITSKSRESHCGSVLRPPYLQVVPGPVTVSLAGCGRAPPEQMDLVTHVLELNGVLQPIGNSEPFGLICQDLLPESLFGIGA